MEDGRPTRRAYGRPRESTTGLLSLCVGHTPANKDALFDFARQRLPTSQQRLLRFQRSNALFYSGKRVGGAIVHFCKRKRSVGEQRPQLSRSDRILEIRRRKTRLFLLKGRHHHDATPERRRAVSSLRRRWLGGRGPAAAVPSSLSSRVSSASCVT